MSVLSAYFDAGIDQRSPVQKDVRRVVNYDKDGNEYITFVEEDYPSIQKSLGTVDNWSLETLIRAGIDPAFVIRTGLPTRIEGIGYVDSALRIVDSLISDNSVKSE